MLPIRRKSSSIFFILVDIKSPLFADKFHVLYPTFQVPKVVATSYKDSCHLPLASTFHSYWDCCLIKVRRTDSATKRACNTLCNKLLHKAQIFFF